MRQRIQLALLLAVALVLLAAPGCKAPQNGISVELAKTVNGHKMAEALKGDALVVTVRNDNQLFLGTDRIASDMLIARAKDWSYDHIDRRVFIKADADARYGTLLEMFDSLRDAGVTEFGLLTKQRDAKKSSEEVPTGLDVNDELPIFLPPLPVNAYRPLSVVVLPTTSGVRLRMNQEHVPCADLHAESGPCLDHLREKLRAIFESQAEKLLFVKADPFLPFNDVAQVIDAAYGAGLDKIGMVTPKLELESPFAVPKVLH